MQSWCSQLQCSVNLSVITDLLRTSGRRAVQVAPVPQEGMAVDVSDSSGLIEFTQDQPYVMERRDDKERIPFQCSQVCACCQDSPPPASHLLSHPLQKDRLSCDLPRFCQYLAPLCISPCHIPAFARKSVRNLTSNTGQNFV